HLAVQEVVLPLRAIGRQEPGSRVAHPLQYPLDVAALVIGEMRLSGAVLDPGEPRSGVPGAAARAIAEVQDAGRNVVVPARLDHFYASGTGAAVELGERAVRRVVGEGDDLPPGVGPFDRIADLVVSSAQETPVRVVD